MRLYVPLEFWFCRNPGLALPLIALQYHEVKIHLDLEEAAYLIRNDQDHVSAPKDVDGNDLEIKSCDLLVNYIYLDTDERRRFAQTSHEYLIEQLQFTGDESTVNTNVKVKLNLNHPVKELIWVCQREKAAGEGGDEKQAWDKYRRSG